MKKIVVLSQVFYPDMQATSQLFSDLFQKLAGEDFQIRVICGLETRAALFIFLSGSKLERPKKPRM